MAPNMATWQYTVLYFTFTALYHYLLLQNFICFGVCLRKWEKYYPWVNNCSLLILCPCVLVSCYPSFTMFSFVSACFPSVLQFLIIFQHLFMFSNMHTCMHMCVCLSVTCHSKTLSYYLMFSKWGNSRPSKYSSDLQIPCF